MHKSVNWDTPTVLRSWCNMTWGLKVTYPSSDVPFYHYLMLLSSPTTAALTNHSTDTCLSAHVTVSQEWSTFTPECLLCFLPVFGSVRHVWTLVCDPHQKHRSEAARTRCLGPTANELWYWYECSISFNRGNDGYIRLVFACLESYK